MDEVISHYRLIRRIGSGGMGIVYEAEDLTLGRRIALKLLPENMTGNDAIERFRREARAASALNHPSVCTVYEIGSDAGRHFIGMELLEGEPLTARLAHGPLEAGPLVEFAMQVCDGLSSAHQKGIIHRDLKPANLFLTNQGRAKILDFGVAKLIGNQTSGQEALTVSTALTRADVLVGTLEYMSPEQARGARLDERTDIFSLGAVLYEMATCRRPFSGATAALVFDSILNSKPVPPHHLCPSLPLRLEEIILGMLEKDPDFRPQSAQAIHTELRRLQRDMGTGQVGPATVSGPRPQRPRRKGIAVLPFSNDSGNPDLEYLSDGLTEMLINYMSSVPELRAVPRAAVFHYKGRSFDAAAIARDFKVRYVVTGRLARRQSRLNVGVELLDLTTMEQMWGQQYGANEDQIVELDGVIAGDITASLRLNLTSEITRRLSRRQTSNARAFELYLKGRHAYARFAQEPVLQAIDFGRQAIELEPTFAAAYALAADAYALCGYFRYREPDDVFPKAKAAALRALELDSTLGEPHAALGLIYYIYEWDWSRAEQAFQRAAQLQAEGLGGGTSRAFLMLTMGRIDQAIALCEQALKVDPLSAPVAAASAYIYLHVGDFEKALRQGRNAQQLDPHCYDNPELFPVDLWIDLYQGRGQEALMKYQVLMAEAKMDPAKSALPYVMAHAGMKDEVRYLLQTADLSGADPTKLAMVYAALGDYDVAFAYLDKGVLGHYRGMLEIRTIPDFAPMRSDPRFAAILRRMNLPL